MLAGSGRWRRSSRRTETNDEVKKKQLMDEILRYNEEDLAATWSVFEWLRARIREEGPVRP
jgi:predicted RecB family nuclease